MNGRIVALCAGFAIDALLGDPKSWPHPVRAIGKRIAYDEGRARERFVGALESHEGLALTHGQAERVCGAGIVADVTLVSCLIAAGALKACEMVHPALRIAAETALFYQLIAAKSLSDESMAVYGWLSEGDVTGARQAVGMIVGRDADALDEEGIARATVETIAENTSDGVVAPMLFMGLGGAPAALFYKAVNTLDSMMGYKDERYLNLGWAAAKLDDMVNIVPSRVAGVLMCAAARVVGQDAEGAWRVFLRDRHNHTSPNSAQTEAACAGALGVQLGGPSVYFGKTVSKPTIGDAGRPVEAGDIVRANKLMRATSVLALGAAVVVALTPRRK